MSITTSSSRGSRRLEGEGCERLRRVGRRISSCNGHGSVLHVWEWHVCECMSGSSAPIGLWTAGGRADYAASQGHCVSAILQNFCTILRESPKAAGGISTNNLSDPLSPHGSKLLESPPKMTESQRMPRQEMIDIIARIAGEDGDHPTIIPGLSVHRHSVSAKPNCAAYKRAWRSSSQGANASCSVRKPSSTAPRTTF